MERRLGTVVKVGRVPAGAWRCLDVRLVKGKGGKAHEGGSQRRMEESSGNLNEGTKEIHPVVLCVTGGRRSWYGDGLWNLWSNRSELYTDIQVLDGKVFRILVNNTHEA